MFAFVRFHAHSVTQLVKIRFEQLLPPVLQAENQQTTVGLEMQQVCRKVTRPDGSVVTTETAMLSHGCHIYQILERD